VTVERDDEVVGGSRGSGFLVGMCPRGVDRDAVR
jgi:hypothetical protein